MLHSLTLCNSAQHSLNGWKFVSISHFISILVCTTQQQKISEIIYWWTIHTSKLWRLIPHFYWATCRWFTLGISCTIFFLVVLNFLSPESSIQLQLHKHLPKYLLHPSFHVREEGAHMGEMLSPLLHTKVVEGLSSYQGDETNPWYSETWSHTSQWEHRTEIKNGKGSQEDKVSIAKGSDNWLETGHLMLLQVMPRALGTGRIYKITLHPCLKTFLPWLLINLRVKF